MTKNQCDGCNRGLPLKEGIHEGEGFDFIQCTKHLYLGPHWLSDNEIKEMITDPEKNYTCDSPSVMHYDIGWVWWDECSAYAFGPYSTEEEANTAQLEYAKTL